jgi:hypothetical protein
MRELAHTVKVLESRHGSLIDHGSFNGSHCGSIGDIDAAINDFLDNNSVTSSGSNCSFLNMTVTFDGGIAASDFSNGPALDCGYGQENTCIDTIVITFDAGNSIYNSIRHRRSSIGSLDTSHCDEDENENVTLDGGYSNTDYFKRPSMDFGNASENIQAAHTGHTGHTGHHHLICHIQNNYF